MTKYVVLNIEAQYFSQLYQQIVLYTQKLYNEVSFLDDLYTEPTLNMYKYLGNNSYNLYLYVDVVDKNNGYDMTTNALKGPIVRDTELPFGVRKVTDTILQQQGQTVIFRDGSSYNLRDGALTIPSYKYKVLSYNICYDQNGEKSDMDAFKWDNRKEYIVNDILELDADVICLQELRLEGSVYIQRQLLDKYNFMVYDFNGTPLSFKLLTGWKKDKFFLQETKRWWLSDTPDVFSDTWGGGFGRILSFCDLRVLDNGKITNESFKVYNTHLGLSVKEKFMSSQLIPQLVKMTSNLDAGDKVILCGDFNSFSQEGLDNMKYLLNDMDDFGFDITSTYVGYPYDRYVKEAGHPTRERLDWILTKGVEFGSVKTLVRPRFLYNNMEYTASDHYPLLLQF
ncbi:Endonuclease [Orpheovirus IHUMI-LCC2]|uniref:Endonuclease n=1 Tax=Orpheovirus IHUMI-LCC2 TaxID=2023057 RepID=A0A2I2L4E4_9VIRU|nr:Endonuclease [Orpheovirus IHUMI-LCC2]SNW62394.1 Endonuclease [Orpheovirus IHUMI-LCC2]